jgi:hypothetical protein
MRRTTALLVALLLLSTTLSAVDELDFSELYVPGILGLSFAPRAQALAGKRIDFTGFMAPPLRATGRFFVLTKQPVSLCPFCNSDADWPEDIIVVYIKGEQTFVQRNRPLVVTGKLELGSYRDPETGFVSLVRIVDASYRDR